MPKHGGRMSERLSAAAAEAEYEAALRLLFPYEDKFSRLQMLTETSARTRNSLSVLGLFRRRFKSPVLTMMQEEINKNNVALDRKGRLEAAEVAVHAREKEEDKY